jgi:hypothetical protein
MRLPAGTSVNYRPLSAGKFDYLVNVSEAAFQSMVIATSKAFCGAWACGKSGRLIRQRETSACCGATRP